MKQINRIVFLFILFFISTFSYAQDKVAMAELMRSSGKIYVVVGVLLLIFTGIIVFLLLTEKRISVLEKKIKKDN